MKQSCIELLDKCKIAGAGSVQKLQAEEAAAVEAEDFEAAATCSAQLDEVKQQMRAAEAQLRAADDAAAQLVGHDSSWLPGCCSVLQEHPSSAHAICQSSIQAFVWHW